MDLITIKFIGIILLFHSEPFTNPTRYTAIIANGKKQVTKCDMPIDEHRAYVRVFGETLDGTTWQPDKEPCTAVPICPNGKPCSPPPACTLFEIDGDVLEITGVTNSTIGVTQMRGLDEILPKLTRFFRSLGTDIDLDSAMARSIGSIELTAGELEGVPEPSDMRSAALTVKKGFGNQDSVTIQSKNHSDRTIVVPAGAEIAILNLPPKMAHDDPGTPHPHDTVHPEHWFLHYTLGGHEPKKSDCHAPLSDETAHNPLVTLTKECSATTYP
jgi:hypothetical protein